MPSSGHELLNQSPGEGRVVWIGLRPARGAPLRQVDGVEILPGQGLVGDRWAGRPDGARQVTLIQAEHLDVVAALLCRPAIEPGAVRRNLVIAGVNLLALKGWRFALGEAELVYSGLCHPCPKMETTVGPGAFQALRGHGGITARVVKGGRVREHSRLVPLERVVDSPRPDRGPEDAAPNSRIRVAGPRRALAQ